MQTIAIIEDDESISGLLTEALTEAGCAVTRAYSGTEALMLLERKRPDLILMDLMLPGMPGESLLPYCKGIPVIVISAKAGVEDKVNLLMDGAVDYMTKPFQIRELLARVAVHLRKTPELTNPILEAEGLRTLQRRGQNHFYADDMRSGKTHSGKTFSVWRRGRTKTSGCKEEAWGADRASRALPQYVRHGKSGSAAQIPRHEPGTTPQKNLWKNCSITPWPCPPLRWNASRSLLTGSQKKAFRDFTAP